MDTYNLLDLLDGEISFTEADQTKQISLRGIQIPIIQRDYAQGRVGEEIVRDRFLGALFDALVHDTELQLDFVYGSIKETAKDKNAFLPLDGQQRLTTLFLLYWYVGNKELEGADLEKLRGRLSNFSYATRATAKAFCEEISKIGFPKNPAEKIHNAFWFHKRYENDPTVMSMVRMIAAIDTRYKEVQVPIFGKLSKLCFFVLPMDGFNLTDELYIKMNARGKQLTGFENFKADLINWMKDARNPDREDFYVDTEFEGSKLKYFIAFASKLDNAWTDIFWETAKAQEKNENKIVDNFFLAFINRYLLNEFIVSPSSPKKMQEVEMDERFRFLYNADEIGNTFRYQLFTHYASILNADVVGRMEKILDSLTSHRDQIEESLAPAWPVPQKWSLFDAQISQTQRLLFLGISLYLEQNDFEQLMFSNWLRVVWNIISDPDIRSIGAMISAMRLIKQLSTGSRDIYSFLQLDSNEITRSATNIISLQIEEEALKASLMRDDKWVVQILEAEKHPLFRGNIGFLLEDRPSLDQFEHRLKIAEQLFDGSGSAQIIEDHGLLRYLISQLDSWNKINEFTHLDTYANWELILRRDALGRQVVRDLTNLPDINSIRLVVQSALLKPSTLKHDDVQWNSHFQKTHTALYADVEFFIWRQKQGCSKVKYLHFHHFVIKPSAWYAKVMISTYRNDVISELNERFGLDLQNHRCGQSNYFWGEAIEMLKIVGNEKISFDFDNNSTLTVGIKRKNNPSLDFPNPYDNIWCQKFDFNFSHVLSIEQVIEFVDNVVIQLTELMEPNK